MPIYEYRCTACGHELEALQKISDAPLKRCPACQAEALTKLVSAAGFQLKGSGWYATDFRNGSKPAPKAAAGAKDEGKSESKPTADAKTGSTGETKSETAAAPAAAPAAPATDRT